MTETCESRNDIVGASFTIYPMSDSFVEIILSALKDVDTSKVWMKTDNVTTTVRGKAEHIFDVTKAIFLHAAVTGKHVGYQATYSIGCPGDSDGDAYLAVDEQRMNESKSQLLKQKVAAKFSLYPLGGGNYMDVIYKQIKAMKQHVTVTPSHYSTRLDGDAGAIFDGLESAFKATVDGGSNHTVMTVSISANSPSHK